MAKKIRNSLQAVNTQEMFPLVKKIQEALDGVMKKVGPDAEVIFHSDRGSQYASAAPTLLPLLLV